MTVEYIEKITDAHSEWRRVELMMKSILNLINASRSVAEKLGGGRGAGAPPLRIAMNIHSMKLFNNLIKNTLLAPCSVV